VGSAVAEKRMNTPLSCLITRKPRNASSESEKEKRKKERKEREKRKKRNPIQLPQQEVEPEVDKSEGKRREEARYYTRPHETPTASDKFRII